MLQNERLWTRICVGSWKEVTRAHLADETNATALPGTVYHWFKFISQNNIGKDLNDDGLQGV